MYSSMAPRFPRASGKASLNTSPSRLPPPLVPLGAAETGPRGNCADRLLYLPPQPGERARRPSEPRESRPKRRTVALRASVGRIDRSSSRRVELNLPQSFRRLRLLVADRAYLNRRSQPSLGSVFSLFVDVVPSLEQPLGPFLVVRDRPGRRGL